MDRKPNEYINSVFTMEQPQHHVTSSNEINLRQLSGGGGGSGGQQNLEFNKTVPLEVAKRGGGGGSSSKIGVDVVVEETTSCECLASKLGGMDAARLSKFYSLFLGLLATVALTFSVYLIKLSHVLNASQMATVKFAAQLLFCLPFAYFYRQSLLGPTGSRFWLVARGLVGSLSIVAVYFSIKMINFSDAIAICSSSPILTALFARFFLKHKLHVIHAVMLILSTVGVFFIIRPSFIFGPYGQSKSTEMSPPFILGVSLAIVSAISAGSTYVFIKKLTQQSIHFVVIIFYYTLAGLVLSLSISAVLFICTLTSSINSSSNNNSASINALKFPKNLVLNDIALAFLAGAIGFVGHVSFTLAIARENSYNMAMLRTIDILLAFALDFFISDLTPAPLTLTGAGIIFVSVFILFVHKIYTNRRDRSSDYETNEEVFRI